MFTYIYKISPHPSNISFHRASVVNSAIHKIPSPGNGSTISKTHCPLDFRRVPLLHHLPPANNTSMSTSSNKWHFSIVFLHRSQAPNLMSTILNRNLLRQEIRPSLVSTISQNYSVLLYYNLGLWNGLHRFEVY